MSVHSSTTTTNQLQTSNNNNVEMYTPIQQQQQPFELNGIDILRIPLRSIKTYGISQPLETLIPSREPMERETRRLVTDPAQTMNIPSSSPPLNSIPSMKHPISISNSSPPTPLTSSQTMNSRTTVESNENLISLHHPHSTTTKFSSSSLNTRASHWNIDQEDDHDEQQQDGQPMLILTHQVHSSSSSSSATTRCSKTWRKCSSQFFASHQCRRVATIGLFLFHILMQMILNALCAGQAFLFDKFSLVGVLVFLPKIIIGTMIVIAVQRKQTRLLHFLLGAMLLDLIYVSMFLVIVYSGTLKLGGNGKRFSEEFEMQDHHHHHLEDTVHLRVVDPSGLQSLVSAATSVGVHHGIDQEIKPKPPQNNNPPQQQQQPAVQSVRMEYSIAIQLVELAVIFLTLFWTYSLGSAS